MPHLEWKVRFVHMRIVFPDNTIVRILIDGVC
jgi:hypothetical protein